MSMKFKKCMTAKDMLPPQGEEPGEKCETTKQNVSGGRVEFASHCTGKGTDIKAEGWALYTGETMKSETRMKGTDSGEPMDMTLTMTGKYTGPCH